MRAVRRAARGRRSDAEAAETRQRIIACARHLFADRGFDAVGLRDIAAAAGISHGLLRHHLGSKHAAWEAVVDQAESDYGTELSGHLELDADDDPIALADRFLRKFVATAARHPDLTRLLVREGVVRGPRLEYVLRTLGGSHRTLAPLLKALQARGILRQFDSRSFFHFLLFSASIPFALPALSNGLSELDVASHGERLVRTLLPVRAAARRPRSSMPRST
jgi:TetR/AcrR family transcriptional regulator